MPAAPSPALQHLVERPFHMRDPSGKLWDCVLIQRKNKVGSAQTVNP